MEVFIPMTHKILKMYSVCELPQAFLIIHVNSLSVKSYKKRTKDEGNKITSWSEMKHFSYPLM